MVQSAKNLFTSDLMASRNLVTVRDLRDLAALRQ